MGVLLKMPRKIKVLRIIARLNIGGPTINTILLTRDLNHARFESILVAGEIDRAEGDMTYLAESAGIKPIIIPELCRALNIYKDFIALCKLFALIKKEKPDIIHTHTAKAGTLGRLAGVFYNLTMRFSFKGRRKCILVHTFHGHVLRGYFNKFFSYFFIIIERVLSRFTDKIIVVSESLKNEILSFGIGDENKIKVVHLGFDLEQFLSIPSKSGDCLNIGLVGRLVPIKNHMMFFDAIKLLFLKHGEVIGNCQFFIIGDGELRDKFKDYVKELDIDSKVKFLGWQKDLKKIYQDLDIVALTSLNEGTPVSLIEALASARPVIATDVGGVKDVIGSKIYPEIADRGILVKNDDLDGFTDGLVRLLTDSDLRQKLSIRGRDFVRERFNSKRLIKDTEEVYNMCLS
ncbi:MAG TPA: glycosyltransferase family 1 protein [Candidatus Omnitrophica bacterium]|nr:glycosyltransferase family 1 protein [Candidatus Omnitrophota bacterium]